LRYSGAATNLAAAVRKILITVTAVGFPVVIKVSLVHEVYRFDSLLGELGLISANVLAESNVMLLEKIMIIQGGTVFETMLPPAYNTMLPISGIWIFPNRKHSSTIVIIREHVAWGVFSIRYLNLQKVNTSFLVICERLRNVFTRSALIIVIVLFRVGSIT